MIVFRKIKDAAKHLLISGLILLAMTSVHAQESVCARVKIEIKQELSLERQAFDAEMRITNSLPATILTDINVDVKVTDEMGTAVEITSDPNNTTAKFFIRQTQLQLIDNTSGTGQVAPQSTAIINWILIPAPGSSGNTPLGKRYLVGATLRYHFGTEAQVMELNPDAITVKPLPLLTLDYFLTKEVIADDPFTAAVEAPEPYTLGVRVKNTGMAEAKSLKIDSAQPRIVDNQQGLLVNFQILGSYVQDLPESNSLLIDFGDIAANTSKMGRWQMQSNLSGKFVDFTATFTHSDELGGTLTSLLQATNTHFLLHDVRVDLPGRDYVRDFLGIDGTTLNIYESEGQDNVVTDRSNEATLSAANGGYHLSMPAAQGFFYVRKPDPYQGQKVLGPIVRADAKTMAVENVWLSKTQNADTHLWDYWFNVFDQNSPGGYDVVFKDKSTVPQAPVLQFIPDRTAKEKDQIGFIVEATSPTGLHVNLSASPLPTGATFHDQGNGTAAFDWVPDVGQAGTYVINYLASDGSLSATRSAKITVTTAAPPPGPAIPQVVSPLTSAEIQSLHPALQVLTSTASNDPTQSVLFELYSDAGMATKLGGATVAKNATAGQPTSWQFDQDLNDNTRYYWRARALAANDINSQWVDSDFLINLYNDPPDIFNLTVPAAGVTVDSATPTLTLTNSGDRDGDTLTYGFEVFTDSALTQPFDSTTGIPAGAGGTTDWTVTVPMTNRGIYYWRATATDSHGASTVSVARSFTVVTGNSAPSAPVALSPINGVDVTTAGIANLVVQNSTDADHDTLTYRFQLDTVNTFDSANRRDSNAIVAGSGTTSWPVDLLVENQRYFWRAKAKDFRSESDWSFGEFVMNAANEAPSLPVIANPGDRSWVGTQFPTFSVYASIDPEHDPVQYRFEVYRDSALQTREASATTANLSWQPPSPLADKATHFWRVRAEDSHGAASAWSPATTLFVSTGSYIAPSIALSSPTGIIDARNGTPSIAWEGTDPNIEPTIALYFDKTGSGYAGTRLVDGLRQDAGTHTGSYAWNLSGIAPGAYYAYGEIYDNKGLGHAYAPGTVVVPTNPQLGVVNAVANTSLTIREGRDTATVAISLGKAPTANVAVPLSSSDTTEAYVTPTQVTFTSANWSTPQYVTVVAVADGVKDGDQPYSILAGKAISRDPDYIGRSATTLQGVVVDQNASANTGLSMTSYQLTSKVFVKKTNLWEFHYLAVLTNYGTAVKSVNADIATATGFQISQGHLHFGAIGKDESVLSDKEIILLSTTDVGTAQPVLVWTFKVQ